MKIQIGKKYKDGNGKEWLVEALINGDRYIATHPNPGIGIGYGFYNEAGQKLWGDTGNVMSTTTSTASCGVNLMPTTTKHTGWIVIRLANHGRFPSIFDRVANSRVYATSEEAADYVAKRLLVNSDRAYCTVPIEYIVEE